MRISPNSILSPERVPSRDGGLVAAIADLASRLTDAGPTELVAQDVLERATTVLRAAEGGIWLYDHGGLVRAWVTGDEATNADDVTELMTGDAADPRPELRAALMRYGPRHVGALLFRLDHAFDSEEARFVDALSSMLSAFLANSERARRLEGDLQTRVRELEAQRYFTEGIVDALPLGLYVIDRDYRICAWNRKRETGMQGISRDEAIGRTIFEVLHRQPGEIIKREFDDVFRTGRAQQFQSESNASGELRTYRLSKIPMRNAQKEVTHIVTIGEDITDWVEARDRVSQNEKLAAVGRLAAGIMHEINNPLATISACAEGLSLGGAAPGGPEYLTIIESEVQRCKRIIDGLLDFSRPQPLQRQSIVLNTVVERALALLTHHSRFKQLTVTTDLDSVLPAVHASAEQLIQVLIALLMNAADALPEFGRVTIRTWAGVEMIPERCVGDGPPHAVIVEVQDEGSGISRAHMARIFEPFYTTKEQGRGTGLGLAICYGIVAEHGGRLEVESEPGVGSTFRVILPMEAE